MYAPVSESVHPQTPSLPESNAENPGQPKPFLHCPSGFAMQIQLMCRHSSPPRSGSTLEGLSLIGGQPTVTVSLPPSIHSTRMSCLVMAANHQTESLQTLLRRKQLVVPSQTVYLVDLLSQLMMMGIPVAGNTTLLRTISQFRQLHLQESYFLILGLDDGIEFSQLSTISLPHLLQAICASGKSCLYHF